MKGERGEEGGGGGRSKSSYSFPGCACRFARSALSKTQQPLGSQSDGSFETRVLTSFASPSSSCRLHSSSDQ